MGSDSTKCMPPLLTISALLHSMLPVLCRSERSLSVDDVSIIPISHFNLHSSSCVIRPRTAAGLRALRLDLTLERKRYSPFYYPHQTPLFIRGGYMRR